MSTTLLGEITFSQDSNYDNKKKEVGVIPEKVSPTFLPPI